MNEDFLPRSSFRLCYEPKDWIFVFACPTTKRSFLTARAYGEFCHQFEGWEHYRSLFLSEFERCVTPFEGAFGLTVLRTPKSRQFCRVLSQAKAIVLFAHCDGVSHRIEFADGMIPYDQVVRGVTQNYSGILDLSVCQPGNLAHQFKERAPRITVKSIRTHLDAVGWLWFYGLFFSQFAKEPCSYAEAVTIASTAFSQPSGQGG